MPSVFIIPLINHIVIMAGVLFARNPPIFIPLKIKDLDMSIGPC